MKQTKAYIKRLLKKLANGYEYSEEVEEYTKSSDDDSLVLVKKKITRRYVPPDMLAIKMLLNFDVETNNFSDMSDQELIELKGKLIQKIQEENNDN